MAISSPAVLAAFSAGSGSTPLSSFELFGFTLGATALICVAWVLAGLGERFFDGRLPFPTLVGYAVRAVLLLLVVLVVLTF